MKRARISKKKREAEVLLSLGEVSELVDTADTTETLLSLSEMEPLRSQLLKEKDAVVQTTITLENKNIPHRVSY